MGNPGNPGSNGIKVWCLIDFSSVISNDICLLIKMGIVFSCQGAKGSTGRLGDKGERGKQVKENL